MRRVLQGAYSCFIACFSPHDSLTPLNRPASSDRTKDGIQRNTDSKTRSQVLTPELCVKSNLKLACKLTHQMAKGEIDSIIDNRGCFVNFGSGFIAIFPT